MPNEGKVGFDNKEEQIRGMELNEEKQQVKGRKWEMRELKYFFSRSHFLKGIQHSGIHRVEGI